MTRAAQWMIDTLALCVCAAALTATAAPARVTSQPAGKAVPALAQACPRLPEGAIVPEPAALYSANGALHVGFSFQTRTDAQKRQLFCFMTASGMANPTLHLLPGDVLTVTVTNNTPQGTNPMVIDAPNCGAKVMDTSSTNVHFHGTNVSPACGSDEVIKTLINSGQTFTYTIRFPRDEPPGLYWYHPHVHGMSEAIVQGGATGAIVIDGIEALQPAVRGLPQRLLVLRDQPQLNGLPQDPPSCANGVPNLDVSVNNVPVNSYQDGNTMRYVPAVMPVRVNEAQFWRVANTGSDTILDLALVYDGAPQTLQIVAIDGVPVNTQDGTGPGNPIAVTHFRLPPAGRVEFIATTPPALVHSAQLVTNSINTGTDGDCDPARPLVTLATTPILPQLAQAPARPLAQSAGRRFANLGSAAIDAYHNLYFDEDNPANKFYMTPDNQPDKVYSPNQPPGLYTVQNSVEQWTVYNRTLENHEFHIHQIHFLVKSQDNFGAGHPVAPAITGQYLDMIEVPAWDGKSAVYPSVTLLMDFRGAVVGDFVFHCHILGHEDAGMMNILRVYPNTPQNRKKVSAARAAAPTTSSSPTAAPAAHRM